MFFQIPFCRNGVFILKWSPPDRETSAVVTETAIKSALKHASSEKKENYLP